MKGLNLSTFRKIASDKKTTTLQHADGHQIKIMHGKLPALQRKALEKLPTHDLSGKEPQKMAEGGEADKAPEAAPAQDAAPTQETSQGVPEALAPNDPNDAAQSPTPIMDAAQEKMPAQSPEQKYQSNVDQEYRALKFAAPTIADSQLRQQAEHNVLDTMKASQDANKVVANKQQADQELLNQKRASVGLPPAGPALTASSMQPVQGQAGGASAQGPDVAANTAAADKALSSPFDRASLEHGYNTQQGGIYGEAKAMGDVSERQVPIEQQEQQKQQAILDQTNKTKHDMAALADETLDAYKKQEIKPNHYLESMDTPHRVSNAIGLLLGGFSTPFTGQANPAMTFLNSQIERDIDAQKSNRNGKLNIYNAYMSKFHDADVAYNMARATQLGIYGSQIREAATKSGKPLAMARANIAAGQLEQGILPAINNAHLLGEINKFNGTNPSSPNAGAGSEEHMKAILGAAQVSNPELYKDLQSRYVPGVGLASHAPAAADQERLTKLNALIPLIDKAQALQKNFGMTGAWTPQSRADANSAQQALNVQLNSLTGLNRLNDREYVNYGKQIGDIGGVNAGGTLRTLQNLRSQAESDKNAYTKSMGIRPFVGATGPTGLSPQGEQALKAAQQKYPTMNQGQLIEALRKAGKI